MYKKLLISAGGGIIPRLQQSEQENVVTIAIGLGGTGIKCLSELKNEVYNKIKPDADSDIAEYKHIKFLAIDSDLTSIETDNLYSIDKNTEFLDIGCRDTIGLLKFAKDINDPIFDWLNPDISVFDTHTGSGGVRQIGRLLFLKNCQSFIRKFEELITTARAGLPGDVKLNIHIFTGLGGGTGSGIFLDVCYLINYTLEQMGLYRQTLTFGYFFLPDVNLGEVPTASVHDYIKVNGFAAMKELDYCMNFEQNGGEWKQKYDGFTYTTTTQPVEFAHLVSATDLNSTQRINGRDCAMHTVIDYVLEFVIKPYIPMGNKYSAFSLNSYLCSCKNLIQMVSKRYGACYDYCVLGASNTYLPYKEITTYLASKIFESFNYLNKNIPNENDLGFFIHSNGLKYEDISRELNSQLPTVPIFAVDAKTLQEQCEGITSDTIPQVLSQMRDSIPKIACVLETNKKNLANGAENTLVENANSISSLISRVKKSLIQITSDPAKGPYYAVALLHSSATKDMQDIINGYIVENEQRLAYAKADLGLREETMTYTLREFQNAKLIRKPKGERYVSAVHGYFLAVTKIDSLIALGELLKEFKKQLEDLYNNFFKIFTTVLDNLIVTFNANLTALAEPITTFETYSKPLMTILDLKESLDTSVSEMRIPDIVNHFVDALMNDEKTWISQDENKISTTVTKFFLSEFDVFTNKTIIDYLQIRFKTTDPNLLKNEIYNKVIIPAYYDASPMFWLDMSKYLISNACKFAWCSVPEISPEVQAAADELRSFDNTIQKRIVESCDKISILQMFIGVPLFAYKGVSAYYDCYKKQESAGLHIYEGYGMNKNDYRNLPDIIPFSATTIENRTETQLSNSDEYDFANENKIIDIYDGRDNYINVFDSEAVDIIEKKLAAGDIDIEIPERPNIISKIHIPNDSMYGYQEIVCKDNVLNSLYLMQQVKKQNNLIRRYNSIKEQGKVFDENEEL